ncbi:MAG: arginine repressor [Bacillota bacterium]
MKSRRQMKILEIVKDEIVETQEELARRLGEEGISVTQATISRDIKELHLIKVPVGDGRYRYALREESAALSPSDRFRRLFRECCVGIDHSENIVVVKCLTGTASTAGEAIDGLRWREVVGTVAGDNTVIVVVKPKEATLGTVLKLKELLE